MVDFVMVVMFLGVAACVVFGVGAVKAAFKKLKDKV